MKFTGERFTPTEQGRIRLEHYHRYAVALDVVRGKSVLDIACGEGYGSFLMADLADSVIGVDISVEAVFHASSTYKKSNLEFFRGGATNLNFPNASFDVVVSFETIEHITEQEQMLAEIRRVLRTDGVLIISSPNRPVYSEESGELNEFHLKELDFQEFDALLQSRFPRVEYFGQRLLLSTVVQPLHGRPSTSFVWSDDGRDLHRTAASLKNPVYFLAVCGSNDVDLPHLGMSVFYPESMDLVEHYVGFAKWAKSLEKIVGERDGQIVSLGQTLTERDGQIASLSQALTERDGQIASLSQALTERDGQIVSLSHTLADRERQIVSLNDETVRRGEWALGLEAALREAQAKLLAVTSSNSWRLTLPLREAHRWLLSPLPQAKRYTTITLRLAKSLYQALPLSYQTKAKHRQLIAKYSPRLLLAAGTSATIIPALAIPVVPLNRDSLVGSQKNSPDCKTCADRLVIPASNCPQVSVIIPIYGKTNYTLRCLASIAINLPKIAFEVIVVDDCSPDDSFDILRAIAGIRLLRNETNQGFIRSCNSGAKAARGNYLYFLNNDTEVTPGWLDELLSTFHQFPGTGLAGSKLIYPDGRLQEAGCIIWQDGSAWNFGRFQNPHLPAFNYAREVDYCSGASIMVPRVLFEKLGGFDEHYQPAYCEDSDLALKIRDNGYRVIYQPLSTVVHHEGITSGTDTSQGTKAYQVENSKKLFARWQHRLATHKAPGTEINAAKDRRSTRRALVLDHCTPTPNQDAGSVTVFNILLLLREMDFQVTFIPEDNFLYMPEYTVALQRAGIEVLYGPYVTSVEKHIMKYGASYDLIFIFRPGVVDRHLKPIRKYCQKAKVLFHTVDLHFLRISREAELQSDKAKQKMADEMRELELAAIRNCDASIVHSTAELEILRAQLPAAKIHVFPLILDTKKTSNSFGERRDIVFVGSYQHSPNVDAVKYFIAEIMPLLRRKLPGVRFYAVGSKPPEEIRALAAEDVIITGFVTDLIPLINKMRISVAPLRFGAGIKGKIGTAMAVGLPVVATSLAAEGMSLTDGKNILVADSPDSFANAIVKVYEDEALWDHIRENGLSFAEQAWGGESAWKKLAAILADLGIQAKRSAHPLSLYSEISAPSPIQCDMLLPIGSVKGRQDYMRLLANSHLKQTDRITKYILTHSKGEAFTVDGFCVPCNKTVSFLVDMQSGGRLNAHGWTPNWRERLECPLCQMNNRQRLIATLVKQALFDTLGQQIYLMEQVTPIYNWVATNFKNHTVFGSEYLGHEYPSGTVVKGIRHENIENLSFSNGQLDLIISNDVFEHIPNPAKAFAECVRVLKNGGLMLATIPFHSRNDLSVVRAKLENGQLKHILPSLFHGNPVSADGSLVFTDFGWDLLATMKEAGFSDVVIDVYSSPELGHLGDGQLIFRSKK